MRCLQGMWVDWVDSPILSMYTYLRTELAAACTMINGRHTEADQVIGCVCTQIITHNSGFSISHYTICLMALLHPPSLLTSLHRVYLTFLPSLHRVLMASLLSKSLRAFFSSEGVLCNTLKSGTFYSPHITKAKYRQ